MKNRKLWRSGFKMEINRFDCASPLDSRYIPQDKGLCAKIKEYSGLEIFQKLRRVVPEIVIPRISLLEKRLLKIAEENKDKTISKRIDGRCKGEIAVNEVFRGYELRLRNRREGLQKLSLDFDVCEAVKNDIVSDITYYSVSVLSIEANIANDIRHGFRSDIEEYTQSHSLDPYSLNVGSSTMPHKVNPFNYENVVSLWKAYYPLVNTAIMGQIVEHQRDSTNEELPYRTFELLCALSYVTGSLEKSLKGLVVCV